MEELQSIKRRFEIIGNSSLLNHAIKVATQVAPTDMTVLITGESGSGKESFSKIIHHLSPRKHGQFIAINCGAIPEGTIDSELFGHEKGSFTGASDARKGYFEVTDGGTIFLDEIGEMPLSTQARLLRVLESGEFIRVGSSKAQRSDVRVVAATNVRLNEAVKRGKFRQDLYYRLNTVPIYVPPLRERGEDIDLLFRKFATDFSEKYHTRPIMLREAAKQALLKYKFPGNVRQLKNIVEQISILQGDEREIDAETLKKYLPEDAPAQHFPALLDENQKGSSGGEQFSERDILYKILFDVKRDMNELKQLVLNLLQGRVGNDDIQKYKHLFADTNFSDRQQAAAFLLEEGRHHGDYSHSESNNEQAEESALEYDPVEDVTPQEEESFSLEKKEKETIIKALRKNNHKRKNAAQDLGISERTLYRKIKQYELED
ncbi:MAG: sigma 54-interacting transcriptional regulator [Bernardetiaceae bacterium]|nr:sigma 54-interacting transcriptional regulator [Bernardetiaceae bacterium]